jgi:hypothetical protein
VKYVSKILGVTLLALVASFAFGTSTSYANSAWNAGRIIDDSVFFNKNTMSVGDIQNFLNSKQPNCDTMGTKQSEFGGGTRAQYGASKGYPAPFVCLKDYKENVTTKANNLHGANPGSGAKSSAQIIWDVSQQFNINPQALLVMLHKESDRLLTDDWPWSSQYRAAMGYGCPDSGPNYSANCNSSYYGFYNQVYNAARQFRLYANSPQNYRYKAGQNNTIQFNPDPNCGSASVYIQNQATAGLYNYTPYQPNAATMAVPIGQTAPCGAYGNKNFWYFFNTWFGSSTKKPLDSCPTGTANCVWSFVNISNGHMFYTENTTERTAVYNDNAYIYTGIAFFTRKHPPSNALPVHRLYNGAAQRHLFTANTDERTYLLNTGWQNEGVAFYTDPSWANTGYSVKRLYNKNGNGGHILTSDTKEINRLLSAGYQNEGSVFRSTSPTMSPALPQTGNENIYRFLINNRHMFTSNISERDHLLAMGHRYEGIAWQSPHAGSVSKTPIYRLYDTREGKHFWTTSLNERNMLINMGFWRNEGIGMYAKPSGTKPVYRFYNTRTGAHIFTVSESERASILTYRDYRYEGIAWKL